MKKSAGQVEEIDFKELEKQHKRALEYEKLVWAERQIFTRFSFITKVMGELQRFIYPGMELSCVKEPTFREQKKEFLIKNEYCGLGLYKAYFFNFLNFSDKWSTAHPCILIGTFSWMGWSIHQRGNGKVVDPKTSYFVLTLLLMDKEYQLRYLWCRVNHTGREGDIPIEYLTEERLKNLLADLHNK
ncbi:hypothetical protein A2V49_02490 [candidate division WWE3 bacterium RBG_19FT_COMBO_34_6]|uniref:Uncharacterized protein n=1 Tax=candidate division WWE3 bacterium RBG_19FT_COMBO_34_6 TaxID=1802612 RepID=A0A1F4ULR3_UNCKA|nr:MAG: hypothetical protein A2V49_02490 [candidate division WWE3 bacterium RBG_19FT_COMBO_34_6]